MGDQQLKVFVSSKMEELAAERTAIKEALAEMVIDVFAFEHDAGARSQSIQQAFLQSVETSELYIGVFWKGYGAYTIQEFEHARKLGMDCLIYQKQEQVDAGRDPQLQQFLDEISKVETGLTPKRFHTVAELGEWVKKDVARWQAQIIMERLSTIKTPEIKESRQLYLQTLVDEFERIPLFHLEKKNLVVDDLVPIRLIGLKPTQLNEPEPIGLAELENELPRPQSFSLMELVESHPKFNIISPGGSGKTTALRGLAFTLAKRLLDDSKEEGGPIPVFVRLSSYHGDLVAQVERDMRFQGFLFNEVGIEPWLKQGRAILLLDGFDEISDKKRFLSNLEELSLLVPGLRFVLTSRPTGALNSLNVLSLKSFGLKSLGDAQVAEILKIHLSDTNARELFQLLKDRHMLDPFRHPLMCWFVSLAYGEPTSTPLRLTKGVLYKRVLEESFLHKWEATRSPGLVDYELDLKIGCLARLGYEMVTRDVSTLDVEYAKSICGGVIQEAGEANYKKPAAQLLDEIKETGLLEQVDEDVIFWHLSFRDYFAAVWLKRYAKLLHILKISWRPAWHEALVLLAGIYSDSNARRLLRWLLRFAWLSTRTSRIGPFPWAADQITLLLRFLNETKEPHDDLKDKFLDLVSGSPLFVSRTNIPAESTYFHGSAEDVIASFYIRIGRLGTPKSVEFMQREIIQRRYRIFGLAQFSSVEAIQAILRGFEEPGDKDLMADWLSANLLFRYSTDQLVRQLWNFVLRADTSSLERLVHGMSLALSVTPDDLEMTKDTLAHDEQWLGFLTTLVLLHPNKEVADNALQVIRKFGGHSSNLPLIAEQTFLGALKNERADVRYNALWPLVYSKSDESKEAVAQSLDDEESISLRALDVLRLRDRRGFPDHMIRVLRRRFSTVFDAEANLRKLISDNLSANLTSFPDSESLEKAQVLILGTQIPKEKVYRLFSVKALGALGIESVEPYVAHVLKEDPDADVRAEALKSIFSLLNVKAVSYITRSLEDDSPKVRVRAAICLAHIPREAALPAVPLLQKMTEDPDEFARRYARFSLSQISKAEPNSQNL